MKSIATSILAFAFAASIASAQAATSDAMYARPGQLVNAGPTKLNFHCMGSGTPTVVFDAGWEDWSPSWVLVQPVISRHARTCTFDRAGSGFSEAGPMPRTSMEIAKELHTAITFETIGRDNPLAATTFSVLIAAAWASSRACCWCWCCDECG